MRSLDFLYIQQTLCHDEVDQQRNGVYDGGGAVHGAYDLSVDLVVVFADDLGDLPPAVPQYLSALSGKSPVFDAAKPL